MAVELVSLGIVCADVMVRPVERLPKRGALDLVPQLEMHVGGLAGVTAAVFSQLGGSAAFIGRVGEDSFGRYILNTLEAAGVDIRAAKRDPECRSSATVVLISEDGERTFLHHMGSNAATCEADVDFDLVGSAQVLHWGGPSVAPQLDGAPMGRIFERARALGVKTSLDTCYDAKGVWMPLIEPALPHLDLLMSSIEEARCYTSCDEPAAMAHAFRAHGVETVVIKLGAEGLYACNAAEAFHVPAHRVDVVDTTGAGDAACGGFLYGYIQGWPLERCVRLANAVGALTVQCMGGAEAIVSLEETLAFMEDAS